MTSLDRPSLFDNSQLPDPERQMGFVRKFLRGERIKEYGDNINKAIQIARISIKKIGGNSSMEEELGRLEKLVQRKLAGEDIEKEIDITDLISDDTQLQEENIQNNKEITSPFPEPAKEIKKDLSDTEKETSDEIPPAETADPKTIEIKSLLDHAVVYYSEKNMPEAKKYFKKAVIKCAEFKAGGGDLGDLEIEIKNLSMFFLEQ